jgi:peptidoglycan/xylan/chitin deacetylase (PgdA/CDA1 family)
LTPLVEEAPASVVAGVGPPPRQSAYRHLLRAAIPRRVLIDRLPPTPKRTVLLTFDDGPDPRLTLKVLDMLGEHGARALFFVVGRRVLTAPWLLRRIVEAGHLIGNHSHLHHNRRYVIRAPAFCLYLRDARRCQRVIREHLGLTPCFFRPPGGRLTLTTLLVPFVLGLRCVRWSIDSNDWRFRTTAEATAGAAAVLDRVAPRDIVLMHDDKGTIIPLLEILLPGLRERGFDLSSGLDAISR